MGSKSRENTGKISYALHAFTIIPLLILGVISLLLATRYFTKAMYDEVEVELQNAAHQVTAMLDLAYPGDYRLVGDSAYRLFKGSADITEGNEILDRVKKDTCLDITLFYQDTRFLTTITDSEGRRIIGSGAPDIVIKDVLEAGKGHFYTKTLIYYEDYFSYYMPLHNADGSVVGMVFAGKPSSSVNRSIRHSVYPLTIAHLLVTLGASVCVFLYTKKFGSILIRIHRFLSDVSTGNLNASLDASVLRRSDELGDIGRSALIMQRSLRNMMDHDTLTKLYNRRSGQRKLCQIILASSTQHFPFCVAIGDIDFFKSINDTYGHECGDLVLQNIANLLRNHMLHIGFAARWGGEEFLLVFDRMESEEARQSLTELQHKLLSLETQYENQRIQVTMTFGLTAGNTTDFRRLIRQADEKLYEGKSTGRNCIIF